MSLALFTSASDDTIGLALINMVQVVALAWIAFQQYKNSRDKPQ